MSTSYSLKKKGKHTIAWLKISMECYIHKQNMMERNSSAPIVSMDLKGKTF